MLLAQEPRLVKVVLRVITLMEAHVRSAQQDALLAQELRLVRLVLQTTHGTDQILVQLAPQELTQQEEQ